MHLRVGGGTCCSRSASRGSAGASPRGRRNRARPAAYGLVVRCISAWAEEPAIGQRRTTSRRVHLRVGGGTTARRCAHRSTSGASPRGRRNPTSRALTSAPHGCISAWAEEPPSSPWTTPTARVHLRVGGGTSPRGHSRTIRQGASPRGRRNPRPCGSRATRSGCISAWAEEPSLLSATEGERRVHLRVGGGTPFASHSTARCRGASPRGRRNPHSASSRADMPGCISAWAEEPCVAGASPGRRTVHLRVGGGTCITATSE